jgi:ribosomal protein S8
MTASNDRLERIESIVQANAQAIAQHSTWFERMERIVESNARAIEVTQAITNSNARAIEVTQAIVNSNARAIEANSNENALMREAIISLVETSEAILERIDLQQSEIRGLQTENRRILDRLEGRDPEQN